jgi:IS605 OrfB family transposase
MGAKGGKIQQIARPFVVPLPAGVRIRARLRVSAADERVLWELGRHLGQLANSDLAIRCRSGGGDADRARRKRELTRVSSSRWAGAVTRNSEDMWSSARRNLALDAARVRQTIRIIEQRLHAPVGGRDGRVRGYSTSAERWEKRRRLEMLKHRLAKADERLHSGQVSVVRGGRRLARARHDLQAAGLSEPEWRRRWEARRLFLCADGEAGKTWGNETVRVHPVDQWLEVKLPTVLSHLANRPYGRYRLSCPVKFSYRSSEWYAQVETGAVRYDVLYDSDRRRWYIDASWTHASRELPRVEEVIANGVVAVDVNSDHLACWVVHSDGNPSGRPHSIPIAPASLKSSARDGHIRHAVHQIISLAQAHGCQAIAIENLNFSDLKAGGREVHGRGGRGKQRRRMLTNLPIRQFRARLVQMCANRGLWVVAVDPAYTSKWGRQHWLGPLKERTQTTVSIHHAAAVVIGRRAVGHRARRRSHVPAGDRRIAHAESCGSGRARSDCVQEPDHSRPDPAAPERRIRQASASGADQGPGHPGPFGAAQRRLDSRRR